MPFGAQLEPDGQVRFGRWAPSARCVELLLVESGLSLPMQSADPSSGWLGLRTPQARAGTLYRYRIDGELRFRTPLRAAIRKT